MVMDPVTGEVKAWVGGIDFKTYKYDHVNLKTKRQVGSSIKPFLYTQAMEERGFTPETECGNEAQFFPAAVGCLQARIVRAVLFQWLMRLHGQRTARPLIL